MQHRETCIALAEAAVSEELDAAGATAEEWGGSLRELALEWLANGNAECYLCAELAAEKQGA